MRLEGAGETSTVTELLARFAGRPWLYELTQPHMAEEWERATAAGMVRLYPHGLTTSEPVDTGDGPYIVVVDGDLQTADQAIFSTNDYLPARVVITGDLRAQSLAFDNGVRIVVEGAAHVERACIGQHGDRDGVLHVYGELSTPILMLDGYSGAYADRGLRALTYSTGWENLEPDIVNAREGLDSRYFPAELLDAYGDLDLDKAIVAARAGTALLLPGVAESVPARLHLRHTTD